MAKNQRDIVGNATDSTWTVTNATEDRTIDANGAVAEIGDGLATLINDLIAQGILKGTVSS